MPGTNRPNDLGRALEVALDSLRADRVRTRAALVALALAMAIVFCLTTLVERGRAATIRSLERAGLKNLYLVNATAPKSAGPAAAGGGLTAADVDRLRAVLPVRVGCPRRIGERIRAMRLEAELTSAALAERVGVSRQIIASLEAGKIEPGSDLIERVAVALSRRLRDFAEE